MIVKIPDNKSCIDSLPPSLHGEMIAGTEFLLGPGETHGLPSPGGCLAGRRDLGDGAGHLGRDAHPCSGLQDVQEVVQFLSVAVTVAGREGVEHRDLGGPRGSVEHWTGNINDE